MSVNNVLKEYDDMKEEIKISDNIKWIFFILNVWYFLKNKKIDIKRKIDGKISLYSCWIDCSFKKFETVDKKELKYLLKGLI